MRDNSGIIHCEKGVKNNENFRCITSIPNLEQQRNWGRNLLRTVNFSSPTGVALGCEKVKKINFTVRDKTIN